jgi:hypothetical protein
MKVPQMPRIWMCMVWEQKCREKSEYGILPDAMPFSVQEYDHGHDANAK